MSTISITKKPKQKITDRRISFRGVLPNAVFLLWTIMTILPLVWMGYSSFKTNAELTRDQFALPNILLNGGEHEFKVVEKSLNIRLPYDPEEDPRERIIIESTSIAPGRRLVIHHLVKEDLPPEIANMQPGDTLLANELPTGMHLGISWDLLWYNYSNAWERGGMARKFLNSIIYTGVSTFLIILLSLMMGFSFAKLGFRKISAILTAVIGLGYLISINSVIIPLFLMLSNIGLTDTHLGIILVYTAFGLPVATLLASQFIRGIPDSLIESAYMDGATVWKMFLGIIVPMTAPVIVTIGIISGFGIWNEFLLVLVLASSDATTSLPVGVYSFSSLTSAQLGWQLAALVIAALPVVVVYFIFNTRITRGVVAGAIKG